MSFSLDHVIIAVDNLKTAINNFRKIGFTTLYGGEHTSGTTHNALICFKDGTYIELLAPTGKRPKEDIEATDFSQLVKNGEGLIGFACHSNNLDQDMNLMHKRGIKSEATVKPGSRLRTDGREIRWKTARFDNSYSPFFIEDVTARNLRVPDDDVTISHENGAVGIMNVFIPVKDLEEAAARYGNMLGVPADENAPGMIFTLKKSSIHLFQPQRESFKDRGEVPYRLVIKTANPDYDMVQLANTHNAHIMMQAEKETTS